MLTRFIDSYASQIAARLVHAHGLSSAAADRKVQASESRILEWYREGVSVELAAARLRPGTKARAGGAGVAHAGRSGGRGSIYERAAGSCKFIPAEAYMIDLDEGEELPPLSSCSTAGMARARLAPSGLTTETAFSSTQQGAMLGDVFGRPMTKGELESAFSGESVDGAKVRAKTVSIYRPKKIVDNVLEVTVAFELQLGNGEFAGRMKRRFFRYPDNNKLVVEHSIIELDRETPGRLGKGVGESIARNSLRWEKAIGFYAVTLHAAWVGRYVWASYGWQWDGEEGENKWRETLEYVDERLDTYRLDGSTILHGEFSFGSDFRAFKAHMKKVAGRPWDLASLHLRGKKTGEPIHVGKVFLAGIDLGRGRYQMGEEGASVWEGQLLLRDGHPTYERAKKKLNL